MANADWKDKYKVRETGKDHFASEENLAKLLAASLDSLKVEVTDSSMRLVSDEIFHWNGQQLTEAYGDIRMVRQECYAIRFGHGYGQEGPPEPNTAKDVITLFSSAQGSGQIKLNPTSFITVGCLFQTALRPDQARDKWRTNWRKARVNVAGNEYFNPQSISATGNINAIKLALLAARFQCGDDELRALGHLNLSRGHILNLLQDKERLGNTATENLTKFLDRTRSFDQEQTSFRINNDVNDARIKANQYTRLITDMESGLHKFLDGRNVMKLTTSIGISGSVFTLLEMFQVKLTRITHLNQISIPFIRTLTSSAKMPVYDVSDEQLSFCSDPVTGNLVGYKEKKDLAEDQINNLMSLVEAHQNKVERAAQLRLERETAELNAQAAAVAAGGGGDEDVEEGENVEITQDQLVSHQYVLMNKLIATLAEQKEEEKERRARSDSRTGRRSEESKNYLKQTIIDSAAEIREMIVLLKAGGDEDSGRQYSHNERWARVQAAITTHKNVQISYDKFKAEHLDKIQVGVSGGGSDDLEVFLNRASIFLETEKAKLKEESERLKDVKREERKYVTDVSVPILYENDFPSWWLVVLPIIRKVEKIDEEVILLQFTEKLKKNLTYTDQDALQHVTKLGAVLAYLEKTYLKNSLIFKKRLEVLKTLRYPRNDEEVISNSTFCLDIINEMKEANWLALIERNHVIRMEQNCHTNRDIEDYTEKLTKFDKLSKANQLKYLNGQVTLEEFDRPEGLTVIPGASGVLTANTGATRTTTEMTAAVSTAAEQTDVIYRLEFFIQQIKKVIEKRKLKISDGMSNRSTKTKSKYSSDNLFRVEEEEEDDYPDDEDQRENLFYTGNKRGQPSSRGRGGRSRGRGGTRGRGQRGRGQRSRGRGRTERPPRSRGGRQSYGDREYSREATERKDDYNRDSNRRSSYRGPRGSRGQRGSRGRGRGGRSEPPMKLCPLNCGDRHKFGSAAYCPNFQKMSILARRQLIKSMKLISPCCLRQGAHSSNQPCRAPPCRYCGGRHHALLCRKGQDGTKNHDDLPKSTSRLTQEGESGYEDEDYPYEEPDDEEYGENDDWYDEESWEEDQEEDYEEDEWTDYDNWEDDSYYDDPDERTFRVSERCPEVSHIFMVTEMPVLSEVHEPELSEIAEIFNTDQNQSHIYFGVPDPEKEDELDNKQYIVDTDHPVIQEMADLVQSNITGERTGLTKVIKLRDELTKSNKMEEFKEKVKPLLKNFKTLPERLGLIKKKKNSDDSKLREDVNVLSTPSPSAKPAKPSEEKEKGEPEKGEPSKLKLSDQLKNKKPKLISPEKKKKMDGAKRLRAITKKMNLPRLVDTDGSSSETDDEDSETDDEDSEAEERELTESSLSGSDSEPDQMGDWYQLDPFFTERERKEREMEEERKSSSKNDEKENETMEVDSEREFNLEELDDVSLDNLIYDTKSDIKEEIRLSCTTRNASNYTLKKNAKRKFDNDEILNTPGGARESFMAVRGLREEFMISQEKELYSAATVDRNESSSGSEERRHRVLLREEAKTKRVEERIRQQKEEPVSKSQVFRQRNITAEEAKAEESLHTEMGDLDPNAYLEIREDSDSPGVKAQFDLMMSEATYLNNKRNRNMQPVYVIRLKVPRDLPLKMRRKWGVLTDANGVDYIKTLALDDTGSDIEIMSSEIFEDLFRGRKDHISCEEGAHLNGVVAASEGRQEQRVKIEILTPSENRMFPSGKCRLSAGLSSNLGYAHEVDELQAEIVARTFGLTHQQKPLFGLDKQIPLKIGLLTSERGAGKMSKILNQQQIRAQGFLRPHTSPNLCLRRTELSADQQWCVSGSLGISAAETFRGSHSFWVHPLDMWVPIGLVEEEDEDGELMIRFEDKPPCDLARADMNFAEDVLLTHKLVRSPEKIEAILKATINGGSEEDKLEKDEISDVKISQLYTEEQKAMDALVTDPLYRDKLEIQRIGLSAISQYRAPGDRTRPPDFVGLKERKPPDLERKKTKKKEDEEDKDSPVLSKETKDLIAKFGLFSLQGENSQNIRFTTNEMKLHAQLREKMARARNEEDYRDKLYDELLKNELNFIAQNPLCEEHSHQVKNCQKCRFNGKLNSEVDRDIFARIVDGSKMKKCGTMPDGTDKYKLVFNLVVDGDREEIFNPSKSNEKETVSNLRKNFRKWCKQKTAAGEPKNLVIHREVMKDIELGTLVPIDKEEMKKIRKMPHSFIPTGAVEKPTSESTKTRLIYDTSRSLPTATTHSLAIRSPKDQLNSIFNTVAALNCYEDGANLDISRAYKNLHLEYEDSLLCLTAWLSDPNDPESEISYYRNVTFNFGVSQAAAALVVGVTYHVWSQAKLAETKEAIRKSGFADDLCFSHGDSSKMDEIIKDAKYAHSKCSLETKYPVRPACFDPEVLQNHETVVDTFGINVDLLTNTMSPSSEVNPNEKKKGRAKGPDISKMTTEEIIYLLVTKRLILRIVMQQYSLSGTFNSVTQMEGKLMLNQTNGITALGEYDEDLSQLCPGVVENFRKYMLEMREWNTIQHARFLIPVNYEFSHIINYRDGSAVAYSSVTFIVSTKINDKIPGPSIFSYICKAKSLLSEKTVPNNECYSCLLASDELKQVVEQYSHVIRKKKSVRIVSYGDSKAISYCWSRKVKVKNIAARNSIVACNSNLDYIVQEAGNVEISLNWINGSDNVADLNSKSAGGTSIAITKSRIWQHGNKYTAEPSRIEEGWFFKINHKERSYRPLQIEGVEIDQSLEILMSPFQKKAQQTDRVEDTPVEITDIRWVDAEVKGKEFDTVETVAKGDWAIPASDEFLEYLIDELLIRFDKMKQFITFLNQRISPQFRGGEKVYWSDWIVFNDGVREDQRKLLRLLIEKMRQRLNQSKVAKHMQEHLVQVGYLVDSDLGDSLNVFCNKEMTSEFNRVLAATPPFAKHPDGTLCEGQREKLELDELPDDLARMLEAIFHFEDKDEFENNLIDGIHENLVKDGLPPGKIERIKISSKEKKMLEAMSLTEDMEEFNKLCDKLELPNCRTMFLAHKVTKQDKDMNTFAKRSIAREAVRLFEHKLRKEKVSRRMIPYILSVLAQGNMFAGQYVTHRRKMKNAENMKRANFIRKTREKQPFSSSSSPSPPPLAAIFHQKEVGELKNTKDWCEDCRKPHKPRGLVREAEKRRSSRKEALFEVPKKELKKEPPEFPWEEPKSKAEIFFRSEAEKDFREAYYKQQIFYLLFDEDEEEAKQARDEAVNEMIDEAIERAVEEVEGYLDPPEERGEAKMIPSERVNWIVEKRTPETHLDWIMVEEPDDCKNREIMEWHSFYRVDHLQPPHPDKKINGSNSRRKLRTYSYYNKYEMKNLRSKVLEQERPVYPYSGARKPDMLSRRIRKKKNQQSKRNLFSLPLKRYQKALMMRAATRKTGVARAQIAVSEVLRGGAIPGIEGKPVRSYNAWDDGSSTPSHSGGITDTDDDDGPDIIVEREVVDVPPLLAAVEPEDAVDGDDEGEDEAGDPLPDYDEDQVWEEAEEAVMLGQEEPAGVNGFADDPHPAGAGGQPAAAVPGVIQAAAGQPAGPQPGGAGGHPPGGQGPPAGGQGPPPGGAAPQVHPPGAQQWHATDAITRTERSLLARGIDRELIMRTYDDVPDYQVCRSEDSIKNPGHVRCPCTLCDFSMPDIPVVEMEEASPFDDKNLSSEIEDYCRDSNFLTVLPVMTRAALKEIERDNLSPPEKDMEDAEDEMWSTRAQRGVGETSEEPALSDEIQRTPGGDPATKLDTEKDIDKLLEKLRAGKEYEDAIGIQFWEREGGGRLWRILRDGPDFPTTYDLEFQMLYRPVAMDLDEFRETMSDREYHELHVQRRLGYWNVSIRDDPKLMRWCTMMAGIRLINEYWRRAQSTLYDERAVNLIQKQICPDSGFGMICPETYTILEQKTNNFEKKLKVVFLVVFSCEKFKRFLKPVYKEVVKQRSEANRRKFVEKGKEETTLFISPTLGKFVDLPEEILRRCFYVLIRTDQMKYLPSLNCQSEKVSGSTEDRFYNAGNLICQEFRLQCSDQYRLYRTCSLPVLHPESPLLRKIIFHNHEIREAAAVFLGRYPHRSVQQTAVKTKSSPVGVTCTGLLKVVQGLVDTCAPCLRAFAKKYSIREGRAYANLSNAAGAFSVVSADPLPGALRVKFSSQRHNFTEINIMAFTCISTGVTILVPMAAMTRAAIALALQDVEVQTKCRVNLMVTDCGSQFERSGEINGHTKVLSHPRGAQYRNRVERSIQNVKKCWRSIFGRQKGEPFTRALTIGELLLLIHLTQAIINSFPYLSSGISPDHVIRPLGYLSPLKDIEDASREFAEHYYNGESPDGTAIYATRMKKFFEFFNEERTNQLILDENRFRAREYKGIVEVEIGDIVYYKNKDERKPAKLGRVIKLTPEGTSAMVEWSGVRSDGHVNRKNIQKVSLHSLHPLVSQRQQYRLGNPSLPLPGKDFPNLVSTKDLLKGAVNVVNHAGCLDCHETQMKDEDFWGADSSEEEMVFDSETTENDLTGPCYVMS